MDSIPIRHLKNKVYYIRDNLADFIGVKGFLIILWKCLEERTKIPECHAVC